MLNWFEVGAGWEVGRLAWEVGSFACRLTSKEADLGLAPGIVKNSGTTRKLDEPLELVELEPFNGFKKVKGDKKKKKKLKDAYLFLQGQ
jgi:hypothetical protein